jgi:hypothetical protein
MFTPHSLINFYLLQIAVLVVRPPGLFADIPDLEVKVSAGDYDRKYAVVSFEVPAALEQGTYDMWSNSGDTVTVQVDDRNIGWFILDQMPAHTERQFTMPTIERSTDDDLSVEREFTAYSISFTVEKNEVIRYHHQERKAPSGIDSIYRRAGYLHPVRSPGGTVVTQEFADVHPHHYGIWAAWTSATVGGADLDFWNVGKGRGRVEFESLDDIWEGNVHAGFRSSHRYMDMTGAEPAAVLNERWEVRVYDGYPGYRIFDVRITQAAEGPHPFILNEYEYGGVGFRGHEDWEGADHAFFLTSEGRTREDGHRTRARWCAIEGYTEGMRAGIAILDHPANLRHPQPMFIHQTRTFFNYAAVQSGGFTIGPDEAYEMYYRFITYDGQADPDEIERMWLDFAHPPAVRVRTVR